MNLRNLAFFAISTVVPASAQLAAPNSAGAAIAHFHINAADIEAQKSFWAKLGGVAVKNEKLEMVRFPGIFVVLRKQDATGPTVGSVVNHVGFHVKDINEWVPKWKAAGIPIEAGNSPQQMFLTGPDNVRVEIIENKDIPSPVAMHHIHLFVPDPIAAQAWYVKHFGAVAGKRGRFDTATVPGGEITIAKEEKTQASTKGRSVDHIGFEVKDIDGFAKKLQADGIKIEEPGMRTSANASRLRLFYIMDPWGTYIEITAGLPPSPAQSAAR